MSLGQTLEEVLVSGQGIERPFRCSQHDDRMASASVNVVKQVWYCHACGAKGKVDDKRAPSVEALLALMSPEKAARHYPDAYLELFDWPGPKYWDHRLAPWVTHQLGMGQDPLSGDATFPVYTPAGVLAGVGRRHVTQDKQTRYLYPKDWSAAPPRNAGLLCAGLSPSPTTVSKYYHSGGDKPPGKLRSTDDSWRSQRG
jgi:hypothetical protein